MFRGPSVAFDAIVSVAVSDVALFAVTVPTFTPVPDTFTVAPLTKFVPVNVTLIVWPWLPLIGATEPRVGEGAAVRFSVTGITVGEFAAPAEVTVIAPL